MVFQQGIGNGGTELLGIWWEETIGELHQRSQTVCILIFNAVACVTLSHVLGDHSVLSKKNPATYLSNAVYENP